MYKLIFFCIIFFNFLNIQAQLKIGANPKDIDSNQYFQVESLNGQNMVIHKNTGNVGVGTSTPASKLEVNGAATNIVAFNAGSNSSIDFTKSNLAYTTATGTSFTLSGLKDGGAYTLILTSTTNTGTASFSASGFTIKNMSTSAMTSGKEHIYSFIVAGTKVYVSMNTEN
jgi:hypothetical protein